MGILMPTPLSTWMFHLYWAPKKSAKPPVPEILSKKFNRGFKLKKGMIQR
jgi:hypothetical protein